MLSLKHLKYLLLFLLSIRNVLGEPQWHQAADGNNYLIDDRYSYTWYDALVECTARNLSMVTIESEEKNQALIEVLKTTNSRLFWIGAVGTKFSGELRFSWVATGEQFSYTYWNRGEPNGDGNENCVLIDQHNFYWNDNNCLWKWSLLCEENPRLSEDKRETSGLKREIFTSSIFYERIQSDIGDIKDILSSLSEDAKDAQNRNEALLDFALN